MWKKILSCAVFAILLTTNAAVGQSEQSSVNPAMSDLDEFMEKVMRKRGADAENLREYVFSERETLDVRMGTKTTPQWSYRRSTRDCEPGNHP